MHSIELERISHLGAPSDEGFVVGRVISAEQHPNADRLRVCEVDDRRRAPGRSSAGRRTSPPARRSRWSRPAPGCPGGEKLKKAKLRGVESDGMILSERELEIGEDHDGIMVLDTDAAPGTPLSRGPAGLRAGDRARADLQPGRLLRRLRGGARAARGHRRRARAGAVGATTPRRPARAPSATTPR